MISTPLSHSVHQFNNGLSVILNVHAPEKLARINVWQSQLWYSDVLRDQMKITRKKFNLEKVPNVTSTQGI